MEQSYQNYKNVLQARMKNLLDDYGNTQPKLVLEDPRLTLMSTDNIISEQPNIKSPVVPIKVVVPSPEIQTTQKSNVVSPSSSKTSNKSWGFLDVLIWIIILGMLALLGYICYLLYLMCSKQGGSCWSVQKPNSEDE